MRPNRMSSVPADSAGEPIHGGASGEADGLGPVEIDLDEDPTETTIGGTRLSELPDGGVVVDFDPMAQRDIDPAAVHDANLAEFMDAPERDALAAKVIELVQADKQSRQDWEGTLAEGIKLLGTKFEDRDWPFRGASGVTDPLLSQAVIRFYADAYAELLPAAGPVKTKVVGLSNEELDDQASRVKEWMNLYLTDLAPEFYPDFQQMLFWLALSGSTFKKVYQDPISGRPVSPFIRADNFIVAYDTQSIFSAQRMTHFEQVSRAEMRANQLAGVWLDYETGQPQDVLNQQSDIVQSAIDTNAGVQKPALNEAEDFPIYETHLNLDLKGFEHLDEDGQPSGLHLPYRVTVDVQNVKILCIKRNWKEGDTTYQRQQCFVHYKLLPGPGFYGYGYCHLLGGSVKTATAIRRQIIDAETLSMFPGGVRAKGMRMENNNLMIGPCQFIEIDTGGQPIGQAIMPMPYRGASAVSVQMLQETYGAGEKLASATELSVGEGRQDAPVGTTLALMEAANKVTSVMIKAAHQSLRQELKLFAGIFGQSLPDAPYPFLVRGGQMAIMRADFSEQIDILPVSDPNITSSAQRIVLAQTKLQMAQMAPEIHNKREAFRQMYVAMDTPEQEIDALLPPPPQAVPMDPLSENMAALNGGPLKAGLEQDHDAHIMVHQSLAQAPNMQAHIAEHLAMKMRVQVEQVLGIQLPPAGTQLPPQVENEIARLVAAAMQQIREPNGPEPSQAQLAMADLQIKAKKVSDQYQVEMGKISVAAMKARMQSHEKDADRESRERVEVLRAAANTADNQNPPEQYVQDVLKIGTDTPFSGPQPQ